MKNNSAGEEKCLVGEISLNVEREVISEEHDGTADKAEKNSSSGA